MATSTDDNEADGNSGKYKVEIIWRRGTSTGFPSAATPCAQFASIAEEEIWVMIPSSGSSFSRKAITSGKSRLYQWK
ncbi:MAG: hypothetical protein LUD12_14960 [Lachnospiraceae bacterium]|nr:hypothetical protein [Lachnospiraceae bacterium]